MAEPKRNNPGKNDNFPKFSRERTQVLNFWDTAIARGRAVTEIVERLAQYDDDNYIAELLVRRKQA